MPESRGELQTLEKLDQNYLNDLVRKAKRGSSNAFAELYAAVSGRQFAYLMYMLHDRRAAEAALLEAFVLALQELGALQRPELFMSWISRISYRYCRELQRSAPVSAGESPQTSVSTQLMNLPLAESQASVMYYSQGMSVREISDILNLGEGTIRRRLRTARRHLRHYKVEGEARAGDAEGRRRRIRRSKSSSEMDAVTEASILAEVFARCEKSPNTLPIEALSSYAVYRKERFSLQRGILAAAMILFLLLPLLFVLPEFDVTEEDTGARGLPVYAVSIRSILPVSSVTASMRGHALPVYEAARRSYSVEPTRNGTLLVEVKLANRQQARKEYSVTDVDADSPVLLGSETSAGKLILCVDDEGIGVDYREVRAAAASGTVIRPLAADAEQGIVFSYPDEAWDIYIPDHIGNTLHLAVHFE
ncbi:MAG: hypothetical protein IJ860_06860 [Eubacterium sp.]|nr:hypothetical protein [Eubacterium sp.]